MDSNIALEGWYAIAQANAIFGHAGWDREMVHFERVMERTRSDSIVICGYMARVRIRVRAGTTEVIREGTGWGSASASTAPAANERALKAAETDATKRALSTFGASFGLSLYDKDHVPSRPRPLFTLFAPDGSVLADNLSPEAYSTGLRQLIELCKDTHQVDQLSRHNRASLADLRIQVPALRNAQAIHFADLLLRLMQKRRERLSGGSGNEHQSASNTVKLANETGAENRAEGNEATEQTGDFDAGSSLQTDRDASSPSFTRHLGAALIESDAANKGRDLPPPIIHAGAHGERRQLGPGDAFLRYTGQSARRRRPYPFPARSEVISGKVIPSTPPGSIAPAGEAGIIGCDEHRATNDESIREQGPSLRSTSTVEGEGGSPPAAQLGATSDPLPSESALPSKIAFGLKIDKSKLLLGLERRMRDKAHLRRVAELPCVVCNRQPSHAHHLRFAQRRGLSQKVSDEYVVPLCALHHGDLHRSSSEQDWWARQRIDPVPLSAELWLSHHQK